MAPPVVPPEFTREAVATNSPKEDQLFHDFWRSGEPFRSMHAANPSMNVDLSKPLEWGKGYYYDTTVPHKHPYWKNHDLPRPTKDIARMRCDIKEWGYCLIESALSEEQLGHMRERLLEQAEGERLAGVALFIHRNNQMVYTLVNKGRCFEGCIEQDPEFVQAGPVIEQLFTEALGPGWICNSFQSIIAWAGGAPQMLHQDQGAIHPFQTPEAPVLFNSLWYMDDVNEFNGGTLVVPGSHKIISAAGTAGAVGELPPAVNLEAPAGTVMLFDGRLLHGTGVNHTDKPRHAMVLSAVRPFWRTQDLWHLVVRSEVIQRASPKLLHRIGFQAINFGVVEGHGIMGSGRVGDPKGDITAYREAVDAGRAVRVGELRPADAEALERDYTFRHTAEGQRALRRAERNLAKARL